MCENDNTRLRVLELYSGIGGMHWALKESGVEYEVVMAVDINTTANQIYKHNFPDDNLNCFSIEKLSLKKLRSLRVNAILMSPPCQPFSRVGKKGDCDDVRTKSFLHILQLLQQIDTKPDYILVENVKGFETSRTRQLLLDALLYCEYAYQEFLLTPLQFGIPNSRLRYYMIAKLKGTPSPLTQTSEMSFTLPTLRDTSSHCDRDQESCQADLGSSSPATQHLGNVNPPTSLSENCPHLLPPGGDKNQSKLSGSGKEEVRSSKSELHCEKCLQPLSSSSSSAACVNPYVDSPCEQCRTTAQEDTSTDGTNRGLHKPADSKEERVFGDEETISRLPGNGKSPDNLHPETTADLLAAGRNMRFCEETDELVTETSKPLSDYLEVFEEGCFDHLLVEDKSLRQFVVMDVVLPSLKKSTCFTKRYGHYVDGAGSLVQMTTSVEDTLAASNFKCKVVELKNKNDWGEEELSIVRKLRLRYFSPREVANLLCFPPDFGFPDSVSTIQKYRCLGNSLNVHIVAKLIRLLVCPSG